MNSKAIKEYKKGLVLTKMQREILVGLLLGDGHLETQNGGKTYRLKVEHSVEQREYLEWVYGYFKEWVRTAPSLKYKNGKPFSYWFTTYTHPLFVSYAKLFYQGRQKIVPPNLREHLTSLGLSVWFMDDGSRKSERHRTYIIHTVGFGKEEQGILQGTLLKEFNIQTTLHRQKEKYWRLYIPSESVMVFRKHVSPYIIPSMRYKLGNINAQKVTEEFIKVG